MLSLCSFNGGVHVDYNDSKGFYCDLDYFFWSINENFA